MNTIRKIARKKGGTTTYKDHFPMKRERPHKMEHLFKQGILGLRPKEQLAEHILGMGMIFGTPHRFDKILVRGILRHLVAELLIAKMPAFEQGFFANLLDTFHEDNGKGVPTGSRLAGNGYERKTAFLGIDLRTELLAIMKAIDKSLDLLNFAHRTMPFYEIAAGLEIR